MVYRLFDRFLNFVCTTFHLNTDYKEFYLFIVACIIIIVLGLGFSPANKRRKIWKEFAKKHGLIYKKGNFKSLNNLRRFNDFSGWQYWITNISDLCQGTISGLKFSIFNKLIPYSKYSGTYVIYIIVESPIVFKDLYIIPISYLKEAEEKGPSVGYNIVLPSTAFMNKYLIKSNDVEFANTILNTDMQELLLRIKEGIYVECHGSETLFTLYENLTPDKTNKLINTILDFFKIVGENSFI